MNRFYKIFAIAAAALAASPAFAHPGSAAHDFTDGIVHPLTGADHLLAFVAVGLWAATRPLGRAWQGPAAFLAALLVGALAGVTFGAAAAVEPLVTASLFAFAGLLLFASRVDERSALALIVTFGLFHGYAHGGEAGSAPFVFCAGFLATSAALHLTGLAIGARLFATRAGRVTAALGIGAAGLALSLA